jgi:hypothetical protein
MKCEVLAAVKIFVFCVVTPYAKQSKAVPLHAMVALGGEEV